MEETTTLAGEERAEQNPLESLQRKAHFTGTVVKTTLAGAIVDINIGVPGVVHISQLQKDPVNRVEDVVQPGQTVDVWVRRVFPKKGRVELTMVKPLDVEWREIEPDMVFKGTVTRIESFGAFVEIGAERPGLVHISELTHRYVKSTDEVVKVGDEVTVKVLKVSRRKKQIKLSMKALEEPPAPVEKPARKPRAERAEHAVAPQGESASQAEGSAAPVERAIPTPRPARLAQFDRVSGERSQEKTDKSERPKRERRERKPRQESEPFEMISVSEGEVPTAFQMAWQAALERAKQREQDEE